MDYTVAQAECLRKIYLAILEQPDQLHYDSKNNRDAVPKPGSRFETLHRYARAAFGVDATIPKDVGIQRLEELFATLDPSFLQHFSTYQDRKDLFEALGEAFSTTSLRRIGPYNQVLTGFWY